MKVFIPGNIPSLKNSKQISQFNGRTILTSSKTVKKYLQNMGIVNFDSRKKEVKLYKTKECLFPVNELKELFRDVKYPTKVGFHFVRGTKHKADFHNIVQILADLMVAFDIIEDDNMDCFIPIPYEIEGKFYSYDKKNPGAYIKLI